MKNNSLALKAYTEIRKKILSIQVSPETRLKEDFWAKKLNVSRIAVREALTRLLGEQLVTIGPKGGFFAASISQVDIPLIRELREILEIGALRLAFEKMTKEKLNKLERICNDFTSMVKQGYLAGANEADLKFHETIVDLSGNPKLQQVYTHSHIPLFHQQMTKRNKTELDYNQTDKEHRAIVESLKKKNLAQAEKHLQLHFARGASLFKED